LWDSGGWCFVCLGPKENKGFKIAEEIQALKHANRTNRLEAAAGDIMVAGGGPYP
jgi:hypothetical protein